MFSVQWKQHNPNIWSGIINRQIALGFDAWNAMEEERINKGRQKWGGGGEKGGRKR